MTTNQQIIALYTLIRRETVRMFRIASQVFLPPVITTSLYFLIFGSLIGSRIGKIDGIPYAEFIAPGLIMMSIIVNAYGNVSSSLYSMRFQKSIDELLVSPMHPALILLGYCVGGIIRGLIVACLVYAIAVFFLPLSFYHLPLTLLVVLLVSAVFSLAGFTNAMVARNFDDIMIIPTFILTPLSYLGGVFYSIDMLPPFWRTVSELNPILYMVSALRYAMLGHTNVPIGLATGIIVLSMVLLIWLNMTLLYRGTGLRE